MEPNWWETTEAQEEQRHIADEVLRLDKERREAEEEEEEEGEEMEVKENGNKERKPDIEVKDEKKPTVRTRVSLQEAVLFDAPLTMADSCNSNLKKLHSSNRWESLRVS